MSTAAHPDETPLGPPMPVPFPPTPADPEALDEQEEVHGHLPEVGARFIWLMVLAQFGVFMAFITPLGYSLAVRVQALAPAHAEDLGYITGSAAFIVMLVGPFMGMWSDRTRTRFGRRRPFMVYGMLLGIVSLLVMALAPNVVVLGLGWILAQLGWGTTLGNLQIANADRLPESQRGKVSGLTGLATQVAPVLGVLLAWRMAHHPLLLFMVPGAVGIVTVLLFVLLVHEEDSRALQHEPLTLAAALKKYLYDPRAYPDFSWNWLGRFLFYFGLTLATTFATFFFADRLHISVDKVAGITAPLAGAGVIAVTAGALSGGFLSDRLRRRKPFVLLGGTLMAAGMLMTAAGVNLVMLAAGSLITSLGLGMFAAIDQALLLDVLPEKATSAGRFMGITGFATSIPQAFAPFIASAILVAASHGGKKDYALLYLIAAVLVALGGAVILRIRTVR